MTVFPFLFPFWYQVGKSIRDRNLNKSYSNQRSRLYSSQLQNPPKPPLIPLMVLWHPPKVVASWSDHWFWNVVIFTNYLIFGCTFTDFKHFLPAILIESSSIFLIHNIQKVILVSKDYFFPLSKDKISWGKAVLCSVQLNPITLYDPKQLCGFWSFPKYLFSSMLYKINWNFGPSKNKATQKWPPMTAYNPYFFIAKSYYIRTSTKFVHSCISYAKLYNLKHNLRDFP